MSTSVCPQKSTVCESPPFWMVVTKWAYSRNETSKTRTFKRLPSTTNPPQKWCPPNFLLKQISGNKRTSKPLCISTAQWAFVELESPPKSARSHLVESASETNYSWGYKGYLTLPPGLMHVTNRSHTGQYWFNIPSPFAKACVPQSPDSLVRTALSSSSSPDEICREKMEHVISKMRVKMT